MKFFYFMAHKNSDTVKIIGEIHKTGGIYVVTVKPEVMKSKLVKMRLDFR